MQKKIPVKPGQICEVEIYSLGSGGEGVGRYEGFTVFVPYALPGEKALVDITAVKPSYASGKIKEIIRRSGDRIEPRCALFGTCGGCQLQHLKYEAQLKAKRQQVIDALARIGKQPDVFVAPTIGAELPWKYRNKVQFPIGKKQGRAIIGCFAAGSHDIIDTTACAIQQAGNDDIVNTVRGIVGELHLPVYDEDRHTGVLRHIVGRVGSRGELMAVIVTATPELPRAKEFVKLMRKRLPHLVSLHQNIQTYKNNVILGRETKLLWGQPAIQDTIGELGFAISPRSFFQVNTRQAEVLYRQALAYADLRGHETVIDVYCGTGTIALFLARHARMAYGIEVVRPAISDAQKNARRNNIKNAEFLVGNAEDVLPRLYRQGVRADVITVDPPRAGCTPTVLNTIAAMRPRRLVYISCNPATLARDLAILDGLGYKAAKVQPVDMFPQTSHVESVCLLSRKNE